MIEAENESLAALAGYATVMVVAAPVLLAVWGARKAKAWRAARAKVEILPPVFEPRTREERAVLAALILAGNRPVTNAELAALMGVSPAEASKRITAVGPRVRRDRAGREVRISLH